MPYEFLFCRVCCEKNKKIFKEVEKKKSLSMSRIASKFMA